MKTKSNLLLIGALLGAALSAVGQLTIQFSTASCQVPELAGTVALTVQRLNDPGPTVNVDYATADGSATAGLKYTAASGTLTFAAGETNRTIRVQILNNGVVEGTQSFQVNLSNPTGGAVLGARSNALVNINDNDRGLHFYQANVSVNEDAATVSIQVARGDDGDNQVRVDYATADNTAHAGQDYTATTGTIIFDPGEFLKSFTVPILNNAIPETSNTFEVILSNPSDGGVLGAPTLATVTITDTDQMVLLSAKNYTVREEAEFVRIGIMRGESDSDGTVDFRTSDSTAKAGLDYVGVTNPIQFSAGEHVKWVNVPILKDALKEAGETFSVALANPTGGALLGSPQTATVAISDNDPGIGFTKSTVSVADAAGVVTLVVARGSDDQQSSFTVDYQTTDGSAHAGQDYESVAGTLVFQPGENLKGLTVPLLENSAATGSNYFTMKLSNPSVGILSTATARVNILHPTAYFPVVPLGHAQPKLRLEDAVGVLSWDGDGLVQHAERVAGPWEDLPGTACPYATQPGSVAGFYRIQNTRPTEVYVPSNYDGQTPMPLFLALHPYGYGVSFIMNYFNLRPLAESEGFLLCYPSGTIDAAGKIFWSGPDFLDFYGSTVDDSGYLRSVIEEIRRQFVVDPKRIYVIGYSSGGAMAHRLAGEHADLIAGIASLAGQTYYDPNRCHPTESVNVLHIQGTLDEYSPYLGGPMMGGLPVVGELPGAVRTVQSWASHNGCRDPEVEAMPSLDLFTDVAGLDTTVLRYTQSPAGGSVELWTMHGGKHYPTLSAEFLPRVVDWLLSHPKP